MKNQITSKILKLTLGLALILFASSCNDDNDAMDAAAEQNAKTNSNQILAGRPAATVAVSFSWDGVVCAGEPKDFCFNAPTGTNLQVQQLIAGDWVQIYQDASSDTNPQCFRYSFATAGVYQLRYKIGAGGFTQVPVTVVNCNSCEESFSYVSNGGGSYTFTYIPAQDLANAELIFTFAQGTYVSGLAGWTDAGVTKHKIMDLVACTTYSWTVVLQSNCNGRGQTEANVWTDFKVGESSKKNVETPTINMSCSN